MAVEMLEWARDLSGKSEYDCLLVFDPELDGDPVIEAASQFFKTVSTFNAHSQTDDWPGAANIYFACTCDYIWTTMQDRYTHFYWLEADNVPLKSNWLTKLDFEWQRGNKPFCGLLEGTYFKDDHGKYQRRGTHMIGTGVYTVDMWRISPLARSLVGYTSAHIPQGLEPQPFDVYLQAEVVPNTFPTDLIQHFWRSRNFRFNGDEIQCDVTTAYGLSDTVRDDAYVAHGCKDGSLVRILRERKFGKRASRPVDPTPVVLGIPHNAPAGSVYKTFAPAPSVTADPLEDVRVLRAVPDAPARENRSMSKAVTPVEMVPDIPTDYHALRKLARQAAKDLGMSPREVLSLTKKELAELIKEAARLEKPKTVSLKSEPEPLVSAGIIVQQDAEEPFGMDKHKEFAEQNNASTRQKMMQIISGMGKV